MRLHLQQPLSYTHILENPKQCDRAFDILQQKLETCPIGSDGCMICHATMTDEICILSCHTIAVSEPKGKNHGHIAIPTGTYLFTQLAYPPKTGAELIPLLNRFVLSGDIRQEKETQLFVRIYKEHESDVTVQLLSPIQTTME